MMARCALYIGYSTIILFTPTSTALRGLILNAGSSIDVGSQTNAGVLKQHFEYQPYTGYIIATNNLFYILYLFITNTKLAAPAARLCHFNRPITGEEKPKPEKLKPKLTFSKKNN